MIKYLTHKEIDKELWDKAVEESFNGNIYAYSWYLDIVHPYWDALVEEDYSRIMPLPVSKKWGVKYMLQPYFTQQLGVFSNSILTPEVVMEFINSIPKDIRLIDINLNSYNRLVGEGLDIVFRKNHLLDLINVYPVTRKHYSSNLKRNLKKAEKAGLAVVKNIKPEEIVKLFRASRGKKVKHWKDKHYLRLQHLMYMAIHKGKGVSYGVYSKENTLLAGACFLKSHFKLVFIFSGQSNDGKKSGALAFLIDNVIKQYSPGNFILDFEGSDNEGLARFYKGFGAKETEYYNYKKNELPLHFSIYYKMKKFL
jgi:hypothetical protein